MSSCCPNCFENNVAKQFITKAGNTGDCDYCNSTGVPVLDPTTLRELFVPLVELYEPLDPSQHYATEPRTLGDLIDEDWSVFSESLAPDERDSLLDDIWLGHMRQKHAIMEVFPSSEWARDSDSKWNLSPEDEWANFADHIKTERRYIFDIEEPDLVDPQGWIQEVITEQGATREFGVEDRFFRGRPGAKENEMPYGGRSPFSMKEMGAPPPELAISGRVNCLGIPVLYAALEEETAIYEAGRFPGAVVSVREVSPLWGVKVADLTQIHEVEQPLGVDNLKPRLRRCRLLNQLNEELSRPVLPSEPEIEYIPTQYLAEAIREAGFDGIAYRSSLNEGGTNLVVFEPDNMVVTETGFVAEITGVKFTHHKDPS